MGTRHSGRKRLEHPAVDWATESVEKHGERTVCVKCPECDEPRRIIVGEVECRIRFGTFTGRCKKHRIHKVGLRYNTKYPRTEHPAVNWDESEIRTLKNGVRLRHVKVTCLQCSDTRWISPGVIASAIAKGTFSGKCANCLGRTMRTPWIILSPGRKLAPSGYVVLQCGAISPEDRHLFDGMRGKKTHVFEHRMVKARELGRPLRSDELVDHMDGNKANNDPTNLRIYIRGKNMPGDIGGYGVFYDEWQCALAEVNRLKAELDEWRFNHAA